MVFSHCSFCGSSGPNHDLRACKTCEAPVCKNCRNPVGECPKQYGHAQAIMPDVPAPKSGTPFVEATVAAPPAPKPKKVVKKRKPSRKAS